MRVKVCTFNCPSYCFSNPLPPSRLPPAPSPAPPLPPPPPLQLQARALETEESLQHPSCKPSTDPALVEEKLCDGTAEIDGDSADGRKRAFLLKSSMKKTCASESKEAVKECVKWMDEQGKELAEIREFEPIEPGEHDEMHGNPTCGCVIQ